MAPQENADYMSPQDRIMFEVGNRFERALGPTQLEEDLNDFFSAIAGVVADDMLSSYESTGIMPDEVLDDVVSDFLERYPDAEIGQEIPLRMISDLVGFNRNGWIYKIHRKRDNFEDIKLAHRTANVLDIMTYVTERRISFRVIQGECMRQIGEVYVRRYKKLADFAKDEDISKRMNEHTSDLKQEAKEYLQNPYALKELFEAFDADNAAYAKMF